MARPWAPCAGYGPEGNISSWRFPYISQNIAGAQVIQERPNSAEDQLVLSLQRAIKGRLESQEISQAEFCRRHKLSTRDISLLFNYFRHQSQGRRNVPRNLINHLAKQFLSDEKKEV